MLYVHEVEAILNMYFCTILFRTILIKRRMETPVAILSARINAVATVLQFIGHKIVPDEILVQRTYVQ